MPKIERARARKPLCDGSMTLGASGTDRISVNGKPAAYNVGVHDGAYHTLSMSGIEAMEFVAWFASIETKPAGELSDNRTMPEKLRALADAIERRPLLRWNITYWGESIGVTFGQDEAQARRNAMAANPCRPPFGIELTLDETAAPVPVEPETVQPAAEKPAAEKLYIVTGRSIDGTVFAQCHKDALSAHCWTGIEADATKLPFDAATRIMEARKRQNRKVEADQRIGQLGILPALESMR